MKDDAVIICANNHKDSNKLKLTNKISNLHANQMKDSEYLREKCDSIIPSSKSIYISQFGHWDVCVSVYAFFPVGNFTARCAGLLRIIQSINISNIYGAGGVYPIWIYTNEMQRKRKK